MRTDLLLPTAMRGLLPDAAVVAWATAAPTPVAGLLALSGLVVATDRLARLRSTAAADRVVVTVGGALVLLVLTGTLLGSTGIGLGHGSWVVALALVTTVELLVALLVPARPAEPTRRLVSTVRARTDRRRTTLLLAPWFVAAVLVAAVSVGVSQTSLTAADRPPVEMSFDAVDGTRVEVVVSTSGALRPVVVSTVAETGDVVTYPLVEVPAGGSASIPVTLPRTGRFVITLAYPDQTEPLRTLVLDR